VSFGAREKVKESGCDFEASASKSKRRMPPRRASVCVRESKRESLLSSDDVKQMKRKKIFVCQFLLIFSSRPLSTNSSLHITLTKHVSFLLLLRLLLLLHLVRFHFLVLPGVPEILRRQSPFAQTDRYNV
jgi:hypothetical protein